MIILRAEISVTIIITRYTGPPRMDIQFLLNFEKISVFRILHRKKEEKKKRRKVKKKE
jgi:hypothetical protein